MKSTQLLSVVLSLIMFTGVTTGSAAFAQSDEYYDELEDILEDFCELTDEERSDAISDYSELDEYKQRLSEICSLDDIDEQYDALFDIIDEIIPVTREDVDDDFDEMEDEFEDESDDVIEDFEDCVDAGYPVMESYPEQCMTDDGTVFVNDEDDHETDKDDERDYDDYLEKRLEHYCDMTDEEKRQLFADHPRLEQFSDRLENYCSMSEDEREDAISDFIESHERDFIGYVDFEMRDKLERYCEMSDEDKRAFIAEHNKTTDHQEMMDRFCSLDEDGRTDFIDEHRDEYKAHMMDNYHDKMSDKMHMDYDRYCAMSDSELATATFDRDFVERASKWCDMTPDERKEYKMMHHDDVKDKAKDKMHDKLSDMPFDRMSDVAKDRMSDVAKAKLHEKMMNLDDSHRLKAMIKSKYDVSDERTDEIKMKYREKYGDKSDKMKMEIKMKYKDHVSKIKSKITDERKAEIHDRLAEMKAFKAELREKASDLTDEEKQQLREDFIEKAKDLQLAWITPHTQMAAGVDATEVECREGFSLVMKASNGVAMCLKADTALTMIDRGIVVPAN